MKIIIATMFLAFQPSFVESSNIAIIPIEKNTKTIQTNFQNLVFDEFWKRENKKKNK